MKYFLRGVVAVALATLATGCLDVKMELLVKKDGSGVITMETVMSADGAKKIAGMAGGMGGEKGADPMAQMKKDMLDTTKLAKTGAQFGPGVKFVKATPIEKADGSFGVKAIYSVADVSKVTMDKVNPGGGPGGGGMNLGMTFGFVKGATPKVTIKTKVKEKPKTPKKVPSDAEIDMNLNMMSMMAGMKVAISVKVDGKITKTNARYKSKNNDGVLLMYMDLDKMMSDKVALKKAIKMGTDDPAVLVEAGVKGVKIEKPGKTIDIEFK